MYLTNFLRRSAHTWKELTDSYVNFTAVESINVFKTQEKKKNWIEHSQICMHQLKISFFRRQALKKEHLFLEKVLVVPLEIRI